MRSKKEIKIRLEKKNHQKIGAKLVYSIIKKINEFELLRFTKRNSKNRSRIGYKLIKNLFGKGECDDNLY